MESSTSLIGLRIQQAPLDNDSRQAIVDVWRKSIQLQGAFNHQAEGRVEIKYVRQIDNVDRNTSLEGWFEKSNAFSLTPTLSLAGEYRMLISFSRNTSAASANQFFERLLETTEAAVEEHDKKVAPDLSQSLMSVHRHVPEASQHTPNFALLRTPALMDGQIPILESFNRRQT